MKEEEEVREKLIKPYTEDWTLQFNSIAKVLLEALSGIQVEIEHIGSTSVRGLAAKPIIDIDIVFHTNEDFTKISDRLHTIGYFHNGVQGIPGREVFTRTYDEGNYPILDKIQHHLYACHQDSRELKRHILFRNYLIEHESVKKEYELLKFNIADEAKQDRKLYAQLKEERGKDLVESIIKKALSQKEEP